MAPVPRSRLQLVGVFALYVALSSILGLSGRILSGIGPLSLARLVWDVWSASLVADLAFVLGTVAVGLAGYRLASDGRIMTGVLVGAVGTWIVYAVSFTLVLSSGPRGLGDLPSGAAIVAAVTTVGLVGIAFGAIGPVFLARLDQLGGFDQFFEPVARG